MPLTPQERAALITIAKGAIAAKLEGKPQPALPQPAGVLGEMRGCFVTLTRNGLLRGCIGTFYPRKPLARQVAEMAVESLHDPRFTNMRVTADELPLLTIEVSVLSELVETSEPQNLQVGTHGIYIIRGGRAGCFLPEVATDMGWTAEKFLSECCWGKAGLPPDAWRSPGTKVYLFTSEKFQD